MRPTNISVVSALLFLELFPLAVIFITFCNGSSYAGCIDSEKKALLKLKHDLDDPSNRLASWIGDEDCCTWAGVVCSNFTGHVLELNLGNPFSYSEYEGYERSKLVGKLNPSLLDLKHLIHLDLSCNDLRGVQIPKYLGFMEKLRYLNLSDVGFAGMVPHQLGNLSNLQYLDLSHNILGLYVENIYWLSGLSSLKHLDLSWVDLGKASDLLQAINSLTSLKVLKLSGCSLHHIPPPSYRNFSSLYALDLSGNKFDNTLIPSWVFDLSHLVFLDLSYNKFEGPIPNGLGNLTSLRHLDLSSNNFNCTIPDWFSKFNSLELLTLEFNNLQGRISSALGNLSSIEILDLSYNLLEGKIPTSFQRLCNLRSIFVSYSNLSQEISQILRTFSGCVSYYLESLDLSHNQLIGHLTHQLGQFRKLRSLDLRENSLFGPIPLSLGKLSYLEYLDLSSNKLNGTLSQIHFANLTKLTKFYLSGNSLIFNIITNWVSPFQLESLKLSSCHLGPKFPSWLRSQKKLSYLDISNTGISDIIPNWFWKSDFQFNYLNLSHNQIQGKIPNLTGTREVILFDLSSNNLSGPLPLISFHISALDLSDNALSGSIFSFIRDKRNMSTIMEFLNLAKNVFTGDIPDCWMNWPNLAILNLGNNNLTGSLPISMGTLSSLWSLNLHNNRLFGIIPVSLKNCTKLVVLNIGGNEFVGNIPAWIGETFSTMVILNLRSNKFRGQLPVELCGLASLQILDLAFNNLSGTVPRCINNFSSMATMKYSRFNAISYYGRAADFVEDASLVIKGVLVDYSNILNLVRSIDISQNYFSGHIPTEVTDLVGLQSLNLSHNLFTGNIPKRIGAMRSLESIDLSENQFYGEIPRSISSLTFLNHLNLSNNNLSGSIPLSTQLQSLDASCFAGNNLCGPPLLRNCTDQDIPAPAAAHENGDDGTEVDYCLYISMTLGFVVGFWCFVGPLLFNRRWRYKYCYFLDRLAYKLGSLA